VAFTGRIESIYQTWRTAAKPQLLSLAKGSRPKELLASLAESVLTDFADAPLLDRYDFFQCLQDYAAEALQDDAYLVAELGWLEASKPQLIVADKDRKTKIEPDFVVGKVKFHSDLLPRRLMIDEYFAEPAVQIAEGEGRLEEKEAEIGAMAEEHGSEGGLLEEIFDDKGKPDRKLLASRLRETAKDPESAEEYALLKEVSDLLSDITERRAAIRQVKTVLDLGLSLRYGELTEDAVKELAVEHKWLGGIHDAIDARTDQARRDLVSAIGSLEARYRTPLGELTRTADTLSARVTDLLRRIDPQWMG
jgi:type I restriction enzyme M protein